MAMPKFWHGRILVDPAVYTFRDNCIITCRQRIKGSLQGLLERCHETVMDSMV